jgi:hypothetical protein
MLLVEVPLDLILAAPIAFLLGLGAALIVCNRYSIRRKDGGPPP